MSAWQYLAVIAAMSDDGDSKSLTAGEKDELWEFINGR